VRIWKRLSGIWTGKSMQERTDYKRLMLEWREECFKVQKERNEAIAERDMWAKICGDLKNKIALMQQTGCSNSQEPIEHPKGQWITAYDPPREGEAVMRVLLQDGQIRYLPYDREKKSWTYEYSYVCLPIAVTHYMLEPDLPEGVRCENE
jgi:hypothetical protein